jgi:hypothetical protein
LCIGFDGGKVETFLGQGVQKFDVAAKSRIGADPLGGKTTDGSGKSHFKAD